MIRRLLHPWLTVRAQIALGAVFVAAALPKLIDPPGFAEAIWNYQLAPAWLIHPAALALPWLEVLCGLALCLGVWVRAAAAWLAALPVNGWRTCAGRSCATSACWPWPPRCWRPGPRAGATDPGLSPET